MTTLSLEWTIVIVVGGPGVAMALGMYAYPEFCDSRDRAKIGKVIVFVLGQLGTLQYSELKNKLRDAGVSVDSQDLEKCLKNLLRQGKIALQTGDMKDDINLTSYALA